MNTNLIQDNQIEQAEQALDTTPSGWQDRGRILAGIGGAAMLLASVALPVVALIGAALAGVVLFTSIKHLGETALVVNAGAATLVALSVTVTLFLLMVATAALALTGKRRTLLIAGLFTLAWLALAVLMAILDTAITVRRIEIEPTLLLIGAFAYSALPALPVIPMVALAVSAAHERHDQYPTVASAGGAMLLSVLKVLLTVATFAFESFFGISLGLNPVAAIFAATLNATAFALALGNIEASRHDGDRSGVRTWGAIATAYALLMFVIAIEAILSLSKSAGASGALAAMDAPEWLEKLALWAFVSSIGLSALLIALTFWRKNARALAGVAASDDTVTIRRPAASRIADGIRAARAGRDEIGSAWRGDVPRLSQGALAKDAPAPDALSDDDLREMVRRIRDEQRQAVASVAQEGDDGPKA
jgi:hypothetical protein